MNMIGRQHHNGGYVRWRHLGRWSWCVGRARGRRRFGVYYSLAADAWVLVMFGLVLAVGHA